MMYSLVNLDIFSSKFFTYIGTIFFTTYTLIIVLLLIVLVTTLFILTADKINDGKTTYLIDSDEFRMKNRRQCSHKWQVDMELLKSAEKSNKDSPECGYGNVLLYDYCQNKKNVVWRCHLCGEVRCAGHTRIGLEPNYGYGSSRKL